MGIQRRLYRFCGAVWGGVRRRLDQRAFIERTNANLRSWIRLPAGWYELNAQLRVHARSLDHLSANARLYLETAQGDCPHTAMGIPFKSGQPTQRLIYIHEPAYIRLDPVEFAGPFLVERFEIKPTKARPAEWAAYNAGFERRPDETLSYARWIAEIEPALIERYAATPASDWVVRLAPGDQLAPHAYQCVASVAAAHPDCVAIYTDHDRLDEQGFRTEPVFKPDWSPIRFKHHNYIGRSVFIRQDALEATGAADGLASLASLLPKLDTAPGRIQHIPLPLLHEAADSPALASSAGLPTGADPGGQVSIIIPTRDGLPHLQVALASLSRTLDATRTEVVLVDNQTQAPDALRYLNQLEHQGHLPDSQIPVRVLRYPHPFNFAAMINAGAAAAKGEILGFLNDDIEALEPGWLEALLPIFSHADIGCVGPMLCYPDGSIQHAGVALGLGGVAGHPARGLNPNDPAVMAAIGGLGEASAVTGAALWVKAEVFQALGGMSEALTVAYNDIDLCLKARAAGFTNVLVPGVRLLHHESRTRGSDASGAKAARLAEEANWMHEHWGAALTDEPYYSPRLTRARDDLALSDS
ncbi:glycosyltransferase [Spiribacter sp. C176]|uniref:Glycosyltransferase n=1 Tax=Spiribacter salilacus TaxID=2664894 RepID=A0A6N7QRG3_9GAMM|nr:glycosyltransferase [Spiribacter salilacus]MRH79051.1 glycosyltransferase [Spiribacter salilacus]